MIRRDKTFAVRTQHLTYFSKVFSSASNSLIYYKLKVLPFKVLCYTIWIILCQEPLLSWNEPKNLCIVTRATFERSGQQKTKSLSLYLRFPHATCSELTKTAGLINFFRTASSTHVFLAALKHCILKITKYSCVFAISTVRKKASTKRTSFSMDRKNVLGQLFKSF